jgi:hypothetical protein
MPMDACFFNHSFPFHRIVGFYRKRQSSYFSRAKNSWIAVCAPKLFKGQAQQFGHLTLSNARIVAPIHNFQISMGYNNLTENLSSWNEIEGACHFGELYF